MQSEVMRINILLECLLRQWPGRVNKDAKVPDAETYSKRILVMPTKVMHCYQGWGGCKFFCDSISGSMFFFKRLRPLF